jgi:hypothetical protein
MTILPRLGSDMVSRNSLFARPRRPDDHREFEHLLPQCTPLFVYNGQHGLDYIRWSVPLAVARSMWGDVKCTCCDKSPGIGEHSMLMDTAVIETEWFFDDGLVIT